MPSPAPDYAEFTDPRLAEIYDTICALGPDEKFFHQKIDEIAPASIIDLGCGTGLFTCELARKGYRVVGIDPAKEMLKIAKKKPGGERIRWLEGSAEQMRGLRADLVLMTSHVAQFFLTEREWHAALRTSRDALEPGGHLVFDTRNPAASPWDRWGKDFLTKYRDPAGRTIETWVEPLEIRKKSALYEIHYFFPETGEELISRNELAYRSPDELKKSLRDAGFTIKKIYGDWDGSAFAADSPEVIFIARRG